LDEFEVPARISAAVRNANLPPRFLAGQFEASPELTPMEAFGRRLIRFGQVHLSGSMCIDVRTQEVVELEGGNVWHTNASIEDFTRCIEVVTARVPFYRRDADAEECEAAAAALEESLIEVDPTCMRTNGYWETFCWDVAIGDYPETAG
jgi:hypothetical protein